MGWSRQAGPLFLAAISASGCIDPSLAQTPRTLPPGEHVWNASAGAAVSTTTNPSTLPILAVGARLGLTERVDAGIRLGPGPIQIDGKFNFLRSRYFDLSINAALGFGVYPGGFGGSSSDGSRPAPYYFFPSSYLIAGVNLGDTVTLVPFTGLFVVDQFGGTNDGVTWLGRSGLGVNFAFQDAGISLQPEVGIFWGRDATAFPLTASLSAIWGHGPR